LFPKYASAFSARGGALAALGKHDQAKADFEAAIRLNPKKSDPYNSFAWCLATHPDAGFRDGRRAIELAKQAAEISGWKDAGVLDTLAAAYAEAGEFDAAVKQQTEAIDHASASNKADYQSRLDSYRRKEPYRAKPGE